MIDLHCLEEEYGGSSYVVRWRILPYFSCGDIKSIVESIKFTRRLVQQGPLKHIFVGMSFGISGSVLLY